MIVISHRDAPLCERNKNGLTDGNGAIFLLIYPTGSKCKNADFDGEGRFVLSFTELRLHQTVLNFSAVTDLRTSVAGRLARELYALSLCRTVKN